MPGLCGDRLRQEGVRQRSSSAVERERLERRPRAGRWTSRSRSRTRIAFRFVARLGGRVVGEELQHLVVERQLPLGDRQADGGRGEALAQRVQHVRVVLLVRRPPALGHDVPVAHEHDAVQRVDLRLGRLDERQDGRRRRCPAPPGRCAAGRSSSRRRQTPKRFPPAARRGSPSRASSWGGILARLRRQLRGAAGSRGSRSDATSAACSTSAPASSSRPPVWLWVRSRSAPIAHGPR